MNDILDDNKRDRLVALTRGAVNAVPFAGGLLGELVTAVIPGQRQERITAYLRDLGARIEKMEAAIAAEALENPEKIDLIEMGGYQAARATSPERISRIVDIVANGLEYDEAKIVRRKRLLTLLGEIDDDELAILIAYGKNRGYHDPDAWESINRPDPVHLRSEKQEIDEYELYELGKQRLLRLDLLKKGYGSVKKGAYPEFDPKTGGFKGNINISQLGLMLLREVGIKLPIDDENPL